MIRRAKGLTAVLAAFALAGLVWVFLDLQRDRWVQQRGQSGADDITRLVARDLTMRLTGTSVLQSLTDHTPDTDAAIRDFESNATRILEMFPGLQAVALLNTDRTIRVVVPAGQAPLSQYFSSDGQADLGLALAKLREGNTVVFSTGLRLANTESTGFVAIKPLFDDQSPGLDLALVFAAEDWFNHVMSSSENPEELRNFSVRITLDSHEVYASPGFDPGAQDRFESRQVVLGTPMHVQAQPSWNAFGLLWTYTPEIMAILVGALALFGIASGERTREARKARALSQQTAEDLRTLNAKLYQEIDARRAAEETAQEAQKMMANFLATMSHEVRTPLNAIMGMFELIENGETSERARRQAHAGRGAAQRLFSELTNVLDVSRLDSHAIEITPAPVDLATAIAHWRETLAALVGNAHKDIVYRVNIGASVQGIAQFDFDRVTQIVTNLMDNAVKFTASGTVTLSVQADSRDVTIRVSDTGSGIPPERQILVFKRFYQIDSGLNRRFDGAGLGLAICQELSNLMGFDLILETSTSDTNNCKADLTGSTFSLKLCNVFSDHVRSLRHDAEPGFEHAHYSCR